MFAVILAVNLLPVLKSVSVMKNLWECCGHGKAQTDRFPASPKGHGFTVLLAGGA